MKDQTFWQEVLVEVERKLGPKNGRGLIESYLTGAALIDADREEVVIAVPREFVKQRIEGKISQAIAAAFETFLGALPIVKIVVDAALLPEGAPRRAPDRALKDAVLKEAARAANEPRPPSATPSATPARAPAESGQVVVRAPERRSRQSGRLSKTDIAGAAGASGQAIVDPAGVVARFGPDLTLENAVVGAGNRLAYRTAERICDNPGGEASPLVVTGGDGLGKTHLLAAIARRLIERRPKAKVLLVTAEDFLNQFLAGIKGSATAAFRERYRRADVVIIDDIHLLRGKEKTQEELSHTLEELKHAEKQVVISCETSPKHTDGLSERLAQRLLTGMVVGLEPPDAETRRRLVEHHAKRLRATLTHDVVDFLARTLTGNIRDIVGAVQRLQAHIAIGEKIDVAKARALTADLVSARASAPMEEIILQVAAEAFHLSPEEVKTGRRQTIARARQVAMFLMRRLTRLSLAEIGRFFTKEPSTVTYAETAIRTAIVSDDALNRIVEGCARVVEERR